MGFLSKVGDFLGDVAGGVLDFGKNVVGNILDPTGLASSALSFGTDYLGNQFITQPQSAEAFRQSQLAATTAYERSKEAATTAWNRSYDAYKRRYRDTTFDMREAGINPIMAVSGGFNVGSGMSAPVASIPQASGYMAHYPQTGSTALSLSRANQAHAETEKVKEEKNLVVKKALTEIQKAAQLRAQSGLMSQQESESVARMFKAEQEFVQISKQIALLAEKTSLTAQETKNARIMETRLKLVNQTLRKELEKISDISNVYSGPAGKVLAYISEILGSFGSVLKGSYHFNR